MWAQLWSSFQAGGWAMWWIFPLGFVAVGAAGRFAWRGEHQLLPFLRWITLTVFVSGCFGSFIGEQKVLGAMISGLSMFAPQDLSTLEQRLFVLVVGTGEASNCLSAALMFVVLCCLLIAIGLRRFPLPNPGVVAR
jgi:hypothetical protein